MFDFLNQQKGQPPALPEGTVRRRYSIEGQVQGVGFRYRARYAAQSLGLTGWVENEDDGSVTLEVQGDPALFLKLFALIQRSDYIQITSMRQRDLAPTHGSEISGCAAAGKRLLQTRSPPESCIPGGCCASIRSSSALYYERVHCRGVLLKIRLSQIRGKCV